MKKDDDTPLLSLTDEDIGILFKAIGTYGFKNQLDIAIEEMSELTKAICKLKRSVKNDDGKVTCSAEAREDVLEELADVLIMVAQVDLIFDHGGEAQEEINYKIKRLEKRLEKDSEG